MLQSLRKLITRFEKSNSDTDRPGKREAPIFWKEWDTFVQAAYRCGFVSPDIYVGPELAHRVHDLLEDPYKANEMDLNQIREVVHFLVRSERWGDMNSDTGGGPLWDSLKGGAAKAIADRLEELQKFAD